MTLQADMLLTTVADELQFSPDQLLVQGIQLVLERQLRLIKTKIVRNHRTVWGDGCRRNGHTVSDGNA